MYVWRVFCSDTHTHTLISVYSPDISSRDKGMLNSSMREMSSSSVPSSRGTSGGSADVAEVGRDPLPSPAPPPVAFPSPLNFPAAPRIAPMNLPEPSKRFEGEELVEEEEEEEILFEEHLILLRASTPSRRHLEKMMRITGKMVPESVPEIPVLR